MVRVSIRRFLHASLPMSKYQLFKDHLYLNTRIPEYVKELREKEPSSFIKQHLRLEELPQSLKNKLRDDLKPKQLKAALQMHQHKILLPTHMLKPPLFIKPRSGGPIRNLSFSKIQKAGRNHHGRITVRHRGGGFRRRVRMLDTKRAPPDPDLEVGNTDGQYGEWVVDRIEHDPNRSAKLALLRSEHVSRRERFARYRYVIAAEGMVPGQVVNDFAPAKKYLAVKRPTLNSILEAKYEKKKRLYESVLPGKRHKTSETKAIEAQKTNETKKTFESKPLEPRVRPSKEETDRLHENKTLGKTYVLTPGSSMPLRMIDPGTAVHSLEWKPGSGCRLVRTAGSKALVVSKDDKYATVKMPSGKELKFPLEARACLGAVGNGPEWGARILGTAGRARRLGRRPSVRGMAMNACDHPNGGGKGGRGPKGKPPKSPWGKLVR